MAYFIFEIGNTMFSSHEDMKGSWKVFLIFAVAVIAVYLLGIKITIQNEALFEAIKKANIYLLWPIVIDGALLGFFKVLSTSLQKAEH